MRKEYHILNGDALKEQFPSELDGEIIVARECLVDGNVKGDSLDDLFKTRARFISKNYPNYVENDYFETVVPEFSKIVDIQEDAEINLWFEDDLFCQVNFWFVCNLLNSYKRGSFIYLIRPEKHNQYGFGGLNSTELNAIYKDRILIEEVDKIACLWKNYQNNNLKNLLDDAKILHDRYPFILTAVEAHIARIPNDFSPGKPTTTLLEIIKELKTTEFGVVFKEFNKRESIYGFGDLQVKRLFDQMIRTNNFK